MRIAQPDSCGPTSRIPRMILDYLQICCKPGAVRMMLVVCRRWCVQSRISPSLSAARAGQPCELALLGR